MNLFVDDDNEVAGIDARSIGSLVAAADKVRGFDRDAAKDLTLGIDQMPLGLHGLFFGEERFHEKRGELRRFARWVSIPLLPL
jgi:hypothetical protein